MLYLSQLVINRRELLAEANPELLLHLSHDKLGKKYGQSSILISSTLKEEGGIAREATEAVLLTEAIQVISCGYENKTQWGKEVTYLKGVVKLKNRFFFLFCFCFGETVHNQFIC